MLKHLIYCLQLILLLISLTVLSNHILYLKNLIFKAAKIPQEVPDPSLEDIKIEVLDPKKVFVVVSDPKLIEKIPDPNLGGGTRSQLSCCAQKREF